MLEFKPLTNTDYFVHPTQTSKMVGPNTVPVANSSVVVTISAAAHKLSKPEQLKRLTPTELFRERIKKLFLNQPESENEKNDE